MNVTVIDLAVVLCVSDLLFTEGMLCLFFSPLYGHSSTKSPETEPSFHGVYVEQVLPHLRALNRADVKQMHSIWQATSHLETDRQSACLSNICQLQKCSGEA